MKDSLKQLALTIKALRAFSKHSSNWLTICILGDTVLSFNIAVYIALNPIIKGIYLTPEQFGLSGMIAGLSILIGASIVGLIKPKHYKIAVYLITLLSLVGMMLYILAGSFWGYCLGLMMGALYYRIYIKTRRKMRDNFQIEVRKLEIVGEIINKTIFTLTTMVVVIAIKLGYTLELMAIMSFLKHVYQLIELEYLKDSFDL